MILRQKEHLDSKLKDELKEYVYDVLGYIMQVYKELPCGMPEYIYQEALAKVLRKNGIAVVADVGTNHRTTTYNNGSCGCLGSARRLWMVWQ